MTAIAKGVIKELQDAEPARKVKVNIAEGMVTQGDPGMLRILLENLLGNAWKFTAKRSEAEIEFGLAEIAGERVYSIRDNGAGFNMEYANKLFKPFQRLHKVNEFQGTGVGLAMIMRVVEKHGGRTWAEGRANEGSTFYFTVGGPDADYGVKK